MATKKLKNNKSKIILATILSFIFAAAFFALYRNGFTVVLADQTDQTFSLEGNGTVDNPYKISTAQDLATFSDYVNGGYVNINAVLAADIVLNEKVVTDEGLLTDGDLQTFVPIGNENNIFQGTFDGKGFTVSGLYYSDETRLYVGLFGRIGEKGIVKNVNVKDSYFLGRQHVGGIVGDNGGNIENCTFSGKIVATFEGLGGIAGGNFGTIKNSRNYAFVEGGTCVNVDTYTTKDKDGNIVTKTTAKNWLCEAIGGIAGANYGYIETSENYGNVSGGANLGGVTGFNNLSVKNSFNKGNVTLNDEKTLISAKNCLSKALNEYQGNYTPSQLLTMRGQLENVDAAIDVLERVKSVCDSITSLPDEIEKENVDRVNAAKKAYDNLTDHEKTLIGDEKISKLQKSIEASEKIVSADENYENVDTGGFFAEIFALIIAFIGILIFIFTFLF